MAITTCPHCGKSGNLPKEIPAGARIKCPGCGQRFEVPEPIQQPVQTTSLTPCPICREPIQPNAKKCKHCGEFLDYSQPTQHLRSSITTPLLISAIANIVIGIFWFCTVCGLPLSFLLFGLCIAEFYLYNDADQITLHELSKRSKTIGVLEIIFGMFNTPTFVCGIIVVLNSGKIRRQIARITS